MRSGVVSARSASVRWRAACAGQSFGHYNFRAARFRFDHVEFVHERAHQKNPAARSAQKILFRQRVRNILQDETGAFVRNVNDHFFRREIDGEMNFLFGLFFVAVMKRVDHAFAHAHPNAVALVFPKTRGFGEAEAHFFRQVHALHLGFQSDFEVLGIFRHPARNHSKMLNSRSVVWVTYRARSRQWRARIEPSWARATYRDLQPHPTITPNSRQIAQNLVFTLPRARLRRYRTSGHALLGGG